jgi:hypothetical protein
MTTLTFYFSTPGDLLAKLRRDYERLCDAVSTGDQEKIADCVFDFSNTGYSVKDWLKQNANSNFTPADVEQYVKESRALDACRDMCNANKHYVITRYVPITGNVYTSASDVSSASLSLPIDRTGVALESEPDQPFKIKVLLSDGTKFEILEFGRNVIDVWDTFISTNGVN